MRVIIIKVVVVVFVVFEINASISHKEGTIANYQYNLQSLYLSYCVCVKAALSKRQQSERGFVFLTVDIIVDNQHGGDKSILTTVSKFCGAENLNISPLLAIHQLRVKCKAGVKQNIGQ